MPKESPLCQHYNIKEEDEDGASSSNVRWPASSERAHMFLALPRLLQLPSHFLHQKFEDAYLDLASLRRDPPTFRDFTGRRLLAAPIFHSLDLHGCHESSTGQRLLLLLQTEAR
ncbi:hypothetical protein SAY87_023099 [Trapa incisa]|uniref:Uncharacterized protein n=1 Tax=Trapa incisa TaxID=236973 RepID=A0AAN7K8V7_9MYRT|nr:hypothetical protein SAY87_023099 [Trapa incisa]